MAFITTPIELGGHICVGCGKPLKWWNTNIYHNSRCLEMFDIRLSALIVQINVGVEDVKE